MAHTPYFKPWRCRLANLGSCVQSLRQQPSLHLEKLFANILPPGLLAPTEEGPNSRRRIYSLRYVFWAFLWQTLNPLAPCREAVRQILSHLGLHDCRPENTNPGNSAYCTARKRLPLAVVEKARKAAAQAAQRRLPTDQSQWLGHDIKVVDGSTVTAADTPANQKKYPQPSIQKRGCGFPLIKILALFSLSSGALLGYAHGNKHKSELSLLRSLLTLIKPRDVLLADRGFCSYVLIWLLQLFSKAHVVFRLHHSRRVDFRRGKKLGPSDGLFTWQKPLVKPRWLPLSLWRKIPVELTIRILEVRLHRRGFRTECVRLATTLLDAQKYSTSALAQLYLRRWRIELWLRHIKTTMHMEHLRCQTPDMLHKELEMYWLAYNLMRCLMAEAAAVHDVPIEQISFKGTVDTVRQYSIVLAQARTQKKQRQLEAMLLSDLAKDLVPDRPGRREPRAVKRRPKAFPLLNRPRNRFKDAPRRSRAQRKNGRKNMDLI